MHCGHLLFVCGDPQRAAFFVLDGGGQLWGQFLPERARVLRQCELRGRIVHDDDVTHAGCGRSARRRVALDDGDLYSGFRAARARRRIRQCRHRRSPRRRRRSKRNSFAKWIAVVEEQRAFRCDVGGAFDGGDHTIVRDAGWSLRRQCRGCLPDARSGRGEACRRHRGRPSLRWCRCRRASGRRLRRGRGRSCGRSLRGLRQGR